MWPRKRDPEKELLEEAFRHTLNDKLMWHREDYYVMRKRYDEMLGRISSIKDEIEAAQIGVDRVGINKNKRYLSESNLSKINRFKTEIRELRKEKASLRKRALKAKRGLEKAAKKKTKRIRRFCVTIGGHRIVVYEKKRTVYAEIIRNERERFGYNRRSAMITFNRKVYTDSDFPQLITLMILLRGGDYLVNSELESPMPDWSTEFLS